MIPLPLNQLFGLITDKFIDMADSGICRKSGVMDGYTNAVALFMNFMFNGRCTLTSELYDLYVQLRYEILPTWAIGPHTYGAIPAYDFNAFCGLVGTGGGGSTPVHLPNDIYLTADGAGMIDPPEGSTVIYLPSTFATVRVRVFRNRELLLQSEYTKSGNEITLNSEVQQDETFLICAY